MYEYIEGSLEYTNPAFAVVGVNGIGYHILISVHTYEKIRNLSRVRLLAHLAVKEDGHFLYGFFDEEERQLFRHLILVNGVGTNTARMILSGQTPSAIISAIGTGNISLLRSVKGVGPKTAQRIVIELQDKVGRISGTDSVPGQKATHTEEAMLALQALGFSRPAADKAIQKILGSKPDASVEELIRQALKLL